MEIKKNFARKIDSKTKKSTILGIVATYSGNVVPNAVSVENERKNGVVQWYNGTFAFSKKVPRPHPIDG